MASFCHRGRGPREGQGAPLRPSGSVLPRLLLGGICEGLVDRGGLHGAAGQALEGAQQRLAVRAGGGLLADGGQLLVVLLHTAVGIDWALLPVTLVLSLVMAGAFTAFHYLLTIAFGRIGLIASLLLLAIQLTATGGLYPIELVASPFRALSPYLPLTYGVAGFFLLFNVVLLGADLVNPIRISQ